MRTESETKKQQLENYAQHPKNLSNFDFQLGLRTKFVNSLRTRIKLQSLPMGHLLVTGPNFSGKSTLMQLIAGLLFDEMRIFAIKIDCNEFKGLLMVDFQISKN